MTMKLAFLLYSMFFAFSTENKSYEKLLPQEIDKSFHDWKHDLQKQEERLHVQEASLQQREENLKKREMSLDEREQRLKGQKKAIHVEGLNMCKRETSVFSREETLKIYEQQLRELMQKFGRCTDTKEAEKRLKSKINALNLKVELFGNTNQVFRKENLLLMIAQFLNAKDFARSLRGVNKVAKNMPIISYLESVGITNVFEEYFFPQKSFSYADFVQFFTIMNAPNTFWFTNSLSLQKIQAKYNINPRLLYSFVFNKNRFYAGKFSEQGNGDMKVSYTFDCSGDGWKVKYFVDGSISAVYHYAPQQNPDAVDISLTSCCNSMYYMCKRQAQKEVISDYRRVPTNAANVNELPFTKKVFLTEELLRHFTKDIKSN